MRSAHAPRHHAPHRANGSPRPLDRSIADALSVLYWELATATSGPGATCPTLDSLTAVTLYSGQFVVASEEALVRRFVPCSGK